MNCTRLRLALVLVSLPISSWLLAQPLDESAEPTPEELDAASTAADAAREAAAFSDEIIEREPADALRSMTRAADLVVRGKVTSQVVDYDEDDIPFTHTTIAVSEVIEGEQPSSDYLTIVQEGGPSRTDPELVYMVSDTNYFNEGDEDVLFLSLDPDSPFPQQRVEIRKRFRIHAGKVYTQTGRGLILDSPAAGGVDRLRVSADRNPDPVFRQIKIGSHTFTRHFGGHGNLGDSTADELPATQSRRAPPSFNDSVDAETFTAAIAQ